MQAYGYNALLSGELIMRLHVNHAPNQQKFEVRKEYALFLK